MTRARGKRRVDITDSWDAIDDHYEAMAPMDDEDDEREEISGSCRADPTRRIRNAALEQVNGRDGVVRRSTRLSVEPELIMPASPDAGSGSRSRTDTPHFRLKERSMTSVAGKRDGNRSKMRASTPHFRLNERSMTSDAGKFRSRLSSEVDKGIDEELVSHASKIWERALQPLLKYFLEVVVMALQNAKPLLGYVLLFYFIFGALVFGVGFLTNSIHRALTPICRIPGTSWLNLPFCTPVSTPEVQGPAEFDKLIQAQSEFEDVLASVQVGAILPMEMKRSEASIRDLKHVVQYSTLPSRNELVFEFGSFIDSARQASQDLSHFNTRIGRAVDQILSTNRWTLNVIDGVRARDASRGSIGKWVVENLNIFAPFQPVSLTRDVLLDQYLRHTSAVEEQILSLISEAQALLHILDSLDGRLDVIASIATRDGVKVQENKDELFAYLWTKLGGNRSQKVKFDQQIELLKEVGAYRRLAWAHVTTTIVKLQAIQGNLEDLRERVAMPEVIGVDKIPLEVHINNINLGIERLEQQRDESRRLEQENYAKILARAEEGNRKLIDDGKDL